jgi:WD40 repeat protein
LPGNDLNVIGFSPDGKLLATRTVYQYGTWPVGKDVPVIGGPIRLWDVRTGEERGALATDWHSTPVVLFAPDGKHVAAVNDEGGLKLWHVATGKEVASLKTKRADPLGGRQPTVLFTPDGDTLVFLDLADKDPWAGTPQLWDIPNQRPQTTLAPAPVFAVSPDGKVVATDGWNQQRGGRTSIKLWDAATGRELATLRGHQFAVDCLAFSPDGRTLASGTVAPGGEV